MDPRESWRKTILKKAKEEQETEGSDQSGDEWLDDCKVYTMNKTIRQDNVAKIIEELKLKDQQDQEAGTEIVWSDSRIEGDPSDSDESSPPSAPSQDQWKSLGISAFSTTIIKVHKFIKILKKRVRNNKMKRNVVEEIIKTEETYQTGIEWLCKWKEELREQSLTTKEESDIIFSNIETILTISQTFLEIARKKAQSWTRESIIGDVFGQITPYFKLYMNYWSNYSAASEFFKEKYEREIYFFKKYIDKQQKKAGQIFESFMITPIQRLPRYEMLIA